MYTDKRLNEIIELSRKGIAQIQTEMKKQDLVMELLLKNAPKEDISKIEKLNLLTKKAINLHKEGRTEEAKNVTDEIKNLM